MARYTVNPDTFWIEADGVPVFPVTVPEIARYAANKAEAREDHRRHAQHIADSLNAGRALPYPVAPEEA